MIADSVVGDSLTDTDHFALLIDAVSAATSATAANYTGRSKGQQGIDVDLLHGIVIELRMALERLQSSEDREGGEAIP